MTHTWSDAQTPATPVELRGLWRREEIFTPSGHRDATTQVLWLQTERFYADIRVPVDRPLRSGEGGFEPYSDEELIKLAAMQGFAGVLTANADVCLWRRDLDYQPPDSVPDEARFEIDGDRMGEFGIHSEYTEIWRRQADSREPLAAFRREAGDPALLVIGGDHFIELESRAVPLPEGQGLADIVRRSLEADRRDQAIAALQMRICYGRIRGSETPWRVGLSTLPWLEGGPLFPSPISFDAAAGILESAGVQWRLQEATCTPDALAKLFKP
jgi:hypothetical protein